MSHPPRAASPTLLTGRFAPSGPFFRWWFVRWWFALCGGFLTVYLSPWAPREWHNTPSLHWLHQVLPYWAMSAGFLLYTILLIADRLSGVILADFLGAAMYLCETVALIWTVDLDRWNGWAFVAFATCVVFHIASGRLAVYLHEST